MSFVCTHLEIIHKEHGHLPDTEKDGADRDPDEESYHVGKGLIFLWPGHPQQQGQETVPFMHFVTCGKENCEIDFRLMLNVDKSCIVYENA